MKRAATHSIVKALRTVDGHAYKKSIVTEKTTPFIGNQGAVGLKTVVYMPARGIALLQSERTPIERQRTKKGFAAMPGEQHFTGCLRLDILAGKQFKKFV